MRIIIRGYCCKNKVTILPIIGNKTVRNTLGNFVLLCFDEFLWVEGVIGL